MRTTLFTILLLFSASLSAQITVVKKGGNKANTLNISNNADNKSLEGKSTGTIGIKNSVFVLSSSYGSLSSALSAVGSTGEIRVNETILSSVSARDTVPSGVTIQVKQGAKLNLDKLLYFAPGSKLIAGPYQIITGNIDSLKLSSGVIDALYPEHFGAVGDSSNNDYSAIKALLSARSGTNIPIFLTDSHYLIGSRVSLESNTEIVGSGLRSTLDFIDDGSANPPNLHLANVDNITLRDFRIKQSNATSRTGTKGLVDIDSSSNISIQNVIFDKSSSTAVWTRDSDNIHISESQVYNTYADGFHFSRSTHNVTVEKCYFYGTADDAISAVGYIDSTLQREPNRNIKYIGNEIRNSQARGIVVMGTVGALISGNEIHNSQKAGILIGATMSGDSVQANRDISIVNNKVYSSGLGGSGALSGIYVSYVRGFSITDCRIDSAQGDGITVTFASLDGDITNNKVSNSARGINLSQVSTTVPRALSDLSVAVGDTGRTRLGLENIIVSKNKLYRNSLDGIYVAGEAALSAKNIILSENISSQNNTSNSASVYNFFMNYVSVGKFSNNIAQSAANNNTITNYATANSTDITYTENYPISVTVSSDPYGSQFYSSTTLTPGAVNTWYKIAPTVIGNLNNVTASNDSLIVVESGVYNVSVSSVMSAATNGETFELGVGFDGANPGDDSKTYEQFSTAGVYKPSSVNVQKVLNAGDSILLMYRNLTATGNLVLRTVVLTVTKVD